MKTFKDTKFGDLTGQIYDGYINVYRKNLDSLEGAPKEVKGSFYCFANNLKNLKYGPEIVDGNFICFDNNLTSLEGAPKIVNGNFNCKNCSKLKSLDELLNTEIRGKVQSDIMTDEEFRELQELYRKANKNMKKLKLLKKLKGIE